MQAPSQRFNTGSMDAKELTSQTEKLNRPQAIALLRERLKAYCDEDQCVCGAAAHFGIFCGGLRNLSDKELRRRFFWISQARPGVTREELERLISLYHIARQEVTGAPTCCDLETREHCACDGWNMFDDRELERLCGELTGRPIQIS